MINEIPEESDEDEREKPDFELNEEQIEDVSGGLKTPNKFINR